MMYRKHRTTKHLAQSVLITTTPTTDAVILLAVAVRVAIVETAVRPFASVPFYSSGYVTNDLNLIVATVRIFAKTQLIDDATVGFDERWLFYFFTTPR